MVKREIKKSVDVCGWCLSAPNMVGGVKEGHSRCAARFGHRCVCAERNHTITKEIAEAMLVYNAWRGEKAAGMRLVFERHGQTMREVSDEQREILAERLKKAREARQ